MSRNLRGRLLSWSKAPENRRIVKAAGLIIALGILVTGADMACSRTQMTPSIERNDYGKGKKVEELEKEKGPDFGRGIRATVFCEGGTGIILKDHQENGQADIGR